MVHSENWITDCTLLVAIILICLSFSLSFPISRPPPNTHMAPVLVNTKNALNINVQFTRFLVSSSLQTSLPGVKKLPWDQT